MIEPGLFFLVYVYVCVCVCAWRGLLFWTSVRTCRENELKLSRQRFRFALLHDFPLRRCQDFLEPWDGSSCWQDVTLNSLCSQNDAVILATGATNLRLQPAPESAFRIRMIRVNLPHFKQRAYSKSPASWGFASISVPDPHHQ